MTVRFQQPHNNGTYFITFTCYKWLPLIQQSDSFSLVYKWFNHLQQKGHHVVGYVIMPNHLHAVIAFSESNQSINTQIGNGKRFLAYGIVEQLKLKQDNKILQVLAEGVNTTDKARGKLHQVFKASFDCKECTSPQMLETKLNYIHNNPCKGKWDLAATPIDYTHSSARFYGTGQHGLCKVTSYAELQDVDLSKPKKEVDAG